MVNEVSNQLKRGLSPCDVKIAFQLEIKKPLNARWIAELYIYIEKRQEKHNQRFQIYRNNRSHSKCWIGLKKKLKNPFHAQYQKLLQTILGTKEITKERMIWFCLLHFSVTSIYFLLNNDTVQEEANVQMHTERGSEHKNNRFKRFMGKISGQLKIKTG